MNSQAFFLELIEKKSGPKINGSIFPAPVLFRPVVMIKCLFPSLPLLVSETSRACRL